MEARTPLAALAALIVVLGCEPPADDDDATAVPTSREDCTAEGDEDEDGAADCGDDACTERFDCRGRLLPASAGLLRHRLSPDRRGMLPLFFRAESGDMDGDGRLDIIFPLNNYPEEDYDWDDFIYGVSVVPSRGIAQDVEVVDVEAASVFAPGVVADPYDSYAPSATSACDLNGDALGDLVFVDTIANIFDPAPVTFEAASVSVAFGATDLGQPDGELPTSVTRLGAMTGWLARVTCLGDIDGDARDDVVVSVSADGAHLTALLDVDRLGTAEELAGASRRVWRFLADAKPGPDLDGDGLREMVMVDRSPSVEWQGREVQREGWVLPGQPSLGVPTTGITSTEDEARPTIAVFIDFQAPGYRSGGKLDFADLDGDGTAEMLVEFPRVPVPEEGWATELDLHFFDATPLGDLSQETVFEIEDIRASFVLPYAEDEPGVGRPVVGDVDGDGNPDLLLPLYNLVLAAGATPEWASDETELWDALAVYFGDGTVEGFSRHWMDADVVVASNIPRGGSIGNVQVVDDIDGAGLPGVLTWWGVVSDALGPDELGFASASFYPGVWLRAGGGP